MTHGSLLQFLARWRSMVAKKEPSYRHIKLAYKRLGFTDIIVRKDGKVDATLGTSRYIGLTYPTLY